MEIFLCHKKKGCIKVVGPEEVLGRNESLIELNNMDWAQITNIIRKKDVYENHQ